MRHTVPDPKQALALIERVDKKYRPVWNGLSSEDKAALACYFLPHRSAKAVIGPSRPRIIKWYCPFACQNDFPSGHRYCINVYTGCDHKCIYCYAAGYEPEASAPKKDFEKLIRRDMADLDQFNVPPAPAHLSNSTDPFQSLEIQLRHTKFALEQIIDHRHRFTTVVVLTKNPLLAIQLGYVDILKDLMELPVDHPKHEQFARNGRPGFIMEISLAFWQESARQEYDECAPSIEDRMEGIRLLREAGIPIVLRIDPLFPRSPLQQHPLRTFADFNLSEAQTIEDLENLISFAKDVSVQHVVYSPAKIVKPRGRKLSQKLQALRSAYEVVASPERLVWRGNSWRLPAHTAQTEIVKPFLRLCEQYGVRAKCCKQNLIETP